MDITIGLELPTWEVEEVNAEKMKTMALVFRDPSPIHWDTSVVAALGMGDRPINQGPVSLSYVANMLIVWLGDPSRIMSLKARFLANVASGESVRAGGRVISILEVNGERRALCDIWLVRSQDDRPVISGTAVVRI
jgi:acyl dehydratase